MIGTFRTGFSKRWNVSNRVFQALERLSEACEQTDRHRTDHDTTLICCRITPDGKTHHTVSEGEKLPRRCSAVYRVKRFTSKEKQSRGYSWKRDENRILKRDLHPRENEYAELRTSVMTEMELLWRNKADRHRRLTEPDGTRQSAPLPGRHFTTDRTGSSTSVPIKNKPKQPAGMPRFFNRCAGWRCWAGCC